MMKNLILSLFRTGQSLNYFKNYKTTTNLSPILTDTFNRQHSYLRISLTELCNLRCQYCMPEEGVNLTPDSELLTTNEIFTLSKLFVELGVSKIRFTGGEPLLRKDLLQIISSTSQLNGIQTVGLTTNGLFLHRKLKELKEAGLNALNISLDTLIPAKFELLTRRKGFDHVMRSINSALELGFSPLKINCVVMKGINDDELLSFVKFSKFQDIDIRFIEYCPFGGNKWSCKKLLPYNQMVKIIQTEYPDLKRIPDQLNDTSKAYKVPGFKGQIGFISSMTENFCSSCNRLRLTADGNLKVCLFGNKEISLRDALRQSMSEDNLRSLISSAINSKKKQHAVLNHVNCDNFKKKLGSQFQIIGHHLKQNNPLSLQQIKLFSTNIDIPNLTHTNDEGKLSMVDINSKTKTTRIAEAEAVIQLGKLAYELVEQNKIKKGDVFSVSKIAGIMAAKNTSSLIPLCHGIEIDHVEITFELIPHNYEVLVKSKVKATDKTGVEMEALTSATVAALTVYDMCKSVSKEIVIKSVRLLYKIGGKENLVLK